MRFLSLHIRESAASYTNVYFGFDNSRNLISMPNASALHDSRINLRPRFQIPIQPDGFLESYLKMNVFEIHNYYSKLSKSVERCDDLLPLGNYEIYRWSTKELRKNSQSSTSSPFIPNYLINELNLRIFEKLVIAARFLQEPLLHADLPIYINLGAIGVRIARLMLFSIVDEVHTSISTNSFQRSRK